jgi:hypothetical protein
METSLRFDSVHKRLHLFAKENFVSDDNVVLTLNGSLCTRTGSVLGKVHSPLLSLAPVKRGDATAAYGDPDTHLSHLHSLDSECMVALAAARLVISVRVVRCSEGWSQVEKEHPSDHLTDRIATRTCRCMQVQLRKKFFPEWLTRVDLGAVYETNADEVKYVVGAKKSFELSDDGLLSLDVKASYRFVHGS